MTDFVRQFLGESKCIIDALDDKAIEQAAVLLHKVRASGGRLFILGVGGSAANASHAVNDFRKIIGIESYAPTDNVSELTARTNDEGWSEIFSQWLRVSRLQAKDCLLILSVGGGSLTRNVSVNLVHALQYAKSQKSSTIGIVSRDGGYTKQVSDVCILIPPLYPDHITPHAESLQALVWHLLVSHPLLKTHQTKWESVEQAEQATQAELL